MNKVFKHKRGSNGLKVVCEFAKSHCGGGASAVVRAGKLATLSLLVAGGFTQAAIVDGTHAGGTSTNGNILVYPDGGTAPDILEPSKNENLVVMGSNTKVGIYGAIVIGHKASTSMNSNTALGTRHLAYFNPYNPNKVVEYTDPKTGVKNKVLVSGDYLSSAVAIGRNSFTDMGGVAIGDSARSETSNGKGLGVAIGANSLSKGGGLAFGSSSVAIGVNSVSIGRQAAAIGAGSIAHGTVSATKGDHSLAIGHSATSLGKRSIAIGMSESHEQYSEPTRTLANDENTIAIGSNANARGKSSITIGQNTSTAEENSIAIGQNTSTSKLNSIAIGNGATTAVIDPKTNKPVNSQYSK